MLKKSIAAVLIASCSIGPAFARCGRADRVVVSNQGGYTAQYRASCYNDVHGFWWSENTSDVLLGQSTEITLPLGYFMTTRMPQYCWVVVYPAGGTEASPKDDQNWDWVPPDDKLINRQCVRTGAIATYTSRGGTLNAYFDCDVSPYTGVGTGPVGGVCSP
jgi:hypothetical protein